MRISIPVGAATAALLLLAPALAAQTAGTDPNATRPAGCRGTTTGQAAISGTNVRGEVVAFPSYPTIEDVQPGSPAEMAGMKPGDVVILQDGHDMVGNPPTQPRFAGDTVQFVVARGGRDIPLTVVLGAWDPPQEAPGVTRVCRPAPRPGG
jgi:C-terminal processing protease CtpA/Prc